MSERAAAAEEAAGAALARASPPPPPPAPSSDPAEHLVVADDPLDDDDGLSDHGFGNRREGPLPSGARSPSSGAAAAAAAAADDADDADGPMEAEEVEVAEPAKASAKSTPPEVAAAAVTWIQPEDDARGPEARRKAMSTLNDKMGRLDDNVRLEELRAAQNRATFCSDRVNLVCDQARILAEVILTADGVGVVPGGRAHEAWAEVQRLLGARTTGGGASMAGQMIACAIGWRCCLETRPNVEAELAAGVFTLTDYGVVARAGICLQLSVLRRRGAGVGCTPRALRLYVKADFSFSRAVEDAARRGASRRFSASLRRYQLAAHVLNVRRDPSAAAELYGALEVDPRQAAAGEAAARALALTADGGPSEASGRTSGGGGGGASSEQQEQPPPQQQHQDAPAARSHPAARKRTVAERVAARDEDDDDEEEHGASQEHGGATDAFTGARAAVRARRNSSSGGERGGASLIAPAAAAPAPAAATAPAAAASPAPAAAAAAASAPHSSTDSMAAANDGQEGDSLLRTKTLGVAASAAAAAPAAPAATKATVAPRTRASVPTWPPSCEQGLRLPAAHCTKIFAGCDAITYLEQAMAPLTTAAAREQSGAALALFGAQPSGGGGGGITLALARGDDPLPFSLDLGQTCLHASRLLCEVGGFDAMAANRDVFMADPRLLGLRLGDMFTSAAVLEHRRAPPDASSGGGGGAGAGDAAGVDRVLSDVAPGTSMLSVFLRGPGTAADKVQGHPFLLDLPEERAAPISHGTVVVSRDCATRPYKVLGGGGSEAGNNNTGAAAEGAAGADLVELRFYVSESVRRRVFNGNDDDSVVRLALASAMIA